MDFFRRRQDTGRADPAALTDEQALERYRYLLSTAPPEDIERAHEEAFAQLTPEQRQQALQALAQYVPASELRGDDPASLARTATRAEMRQPGSIERAWGQGGGGIGLGSWFMATLAASFIGSAIAQQAFASDFHGDGGADDTQGADDGDLADGGWGNGGGWDGGGDFGGGDFGGF